MKILNFGSLNIDHVYQVPHFVQPGETLSAGELEMRLEQRKLKDAEAYFLELERAALAREGSLLGRREE